MTAIRDVDLERSWLDDFRERFALDVDPNLRPGIDEPGLLFRVRSLAGWVEPRIVAIQPAEDVFRTTRSPVTLQVRCFVKVEAKGERQLSLSELVDRVREVVDPRFGVRPLAILDADRQAVGSLQFGAPAERRLYNQQVSVRGDTIPGLDVAILTVPSILSHTVC